MLYNSLLVIAYLRKSYIFSSGSFSFTNLVPCQFKKTQNRYTDYTGGN